MCTCVHAAQSRQRNVNAAARPGGAGTDSRGREAPSAPGPARPVTSRPLAEAAVPTLRSGFKIHPGRPPPPGCVWSAGGGWLAPWARRRSHPPAVGTRCCLCWSLQPEGTGWPGSREAVRIRGVVLQDEGAPGHPHFPGETGREARPFPLVATPWPGTRNGVVIGVREGDSHLGP